MEQLWLILDLLVVTAGFYGSGSSPEMVSIRSGIFWGPGDDYLMDGKNTSRAVTRLSFELRSSRSVHLNRNDEIYQMSPSRAPVRVEGCHGDSVGRSPPGRGSGWGSIQAPHPREGRSHPNLPAPPVDEDRTVVPNRPSET